MIDKRKFERLTARMHETARRASEAKLAAVASEAERRKAVKAMEDAGAAWRKYVSECASIAELPSVLELA